MSSTVGRAMTLTASVGRRGCASTAAKAASRSPLPIRVRSAVTTAAAAATVPTSSTAEAIAKRASHQQPSSSSSSALASAAPAPSAPSRKRVVVSCSRIFSSMANEHQARRHPAGARSESHAVVPPQAMAMAVAKAKTASPAQATAVTTTSTLTPPSHRRRVFSAVAAQSRSGGGGGDDGDDDGDDDDNNDDDNDDDDNDDDDDDDDDNGSCANEGGNAGIAEQRTRTHDERCVTTAMGTEPTPMAAATAAETEDRGRRADDDDPYLTELLSSNGITYDELVALASRRTTPLSLANMYRYASFPDSPSYSERRLRNAQFLHRELPIRIAQRTVDLLTLPHGLDRTRPVRSVVATYLNYLKRFRAMPLPTNEEEERAFTDMLHENVLDRTSIPSSVARGIAELRDSRKEDLDRRRLNEMEDALYRFFTARVGLRFLTEHHVLSARGREERNDDLRRRQSCLDPNCAEQDDYEDEEDHVRVVELNAGTDAGDTRKKETPYMGCIQKNCDPVLQARKVAAQVTRQCRERYGMTPEVEIVDCTSAADVDKNFTYVPHHLQYMLAELLKNSCRATVQRFLSGEVTREDHTSLHGLLDRPMPTFQKSNDANQQNDATHHSSRHHQTDGIVTAGPSLPPIRVIIVKGAEDVTIKVADRAGGLTRTALRKIWSFAHTTNRVDLSTDEQEESTAAAAARFEVDAFSGGSDVRGFGLPLSRIYARYFGGELTVKSMEGHGVDAYLYLPVLGSACENLPDAVMSSPGNLDSTDRRMWFINGRALVGDGDGESNETRNGVAAAAAAANGRSGRWTVNGSNGGPDAIADDGGTIQDRHEDFWTPGWSSRGRGDGITHAGTMDILARRALSR